TNAHYLGIQPTPSGLTLNLSTAFSKSHVTYVGAPIYDTEATAGARLGFAVIIMDIAAIIPEFEHISQRNTGQFYVIDRYGSVYASNSREAIGRPVTPEISRYVQEGDTPSAIRIDGKKIMVQSATLPEIGSTIVSLFQVGPLF